MQLPFRRYIGLSTQQWENTCKEYHRRWGERGQFSVQSCKGAFAVFNLWGSCDENCFKAVFVFKGEGYLKMCLAKDGVMGEKWVENVRDSSKGAPLINSRSPFPPNLECKWKRQTEFTVNSKKSFQYFEKYTYFYSCKVRLRNWNHQSVLLHFWSSLMNIILFV